MADARAYTVQVGEQEFVVSAHSALSALIHVLSPDVKICRLSKASEVFRYQRDIGKIPVSGQNQDTLKVRLDKKLSWPAVQTNLVNDIITD